MTRCLLDTDILSEIIKGRDPVIAARARTYLGQRGRFTTSAVDTAAARQAGRINADLERSGRIIGMPDVMIAGIAIQNGLPLVTGNTAHFEYVRAVGYDLVIQNWRA